MVLSWHPELFPKGPTEQSSDFPLIAIQPACRFNGRLSGAGLYKKRTEK